MPVGLGPVGLSGLYARRGEVQAARAAAAAGVPFTLSTVSACSLERGRRVRRTSSGSSSISSRTAASSRDLIARAKAAGCGALVLTVDLAVPGSRYRDARAAGGGLQAHARSCCARPGLALGRRRSTAARISLGNLEPIVGKRAPLSDFQAWIHANFDPSVSWKDVEWVRAQWNGPADHQGHPRPR